MILAADEIQASQPDSLWLSSNDDFFDNVGNTVYFRDCSQRFLASTDGVGTLSTRCPVEIIPRKSPYKHLPVVNAAGLEISWSAELTANAAHVNEIDPPIVVLDDADAPTALSSDATAYLQSVGITNPATWTAFGLGQVSDADFIRLGLIGKRKPTSSTLCFPTRDPRNYEVVSGVVSLRPSQHVHAFATKPAGLGCTADLKDATRVILCDTPLTVLRLHESGVNGMALCRDSAVLPPLAQWLRSREVVLLSHKQRGLDAMKAVLDGLNIPSRALVISSAPGMMGADLRRQLDLPGKEPAPRIDPTPHLLTRIVEYAQNRLQTGVGIEAIRERNLDQTSLLEVYNAGYLPAEWKDVLTKADEPFMTGRQFGNTFILPATDEHGTIVDLVAYRLADGGGLEHCWDEPRGLIGARLATACHSLVIVDRVADLARLWREGRRDVLLLRGVADAQLNTARLRTSGVQKVRVDTHRDRNEYEAIFRVAGFEVETGQKDECKQEEVKVQPLALVTHDQDCSLATFQSGDLTYVVEVPFDEGFLLDVLARRLGQTHRDRFDMSVDAQRQRFSEAAGRKLNVEGAIILGHLLGILQHLQALVNPKEEAPVQAPDQQSDNLLQHPRLMHTLLSDLASCGWIGDERVRRLGILTLAGRLLEDPPWVLLRGPPTATAMPLGLLADCTPPEWRLHCSRITEASLYHQDRDALHHRILLLDDAQSMRPEAVTALRILQARGGLAFTQAERDAATGRMKTRASDARGPVALLAASAETSPIDPLVIVAPLDDSPDQTARVLAAQRERRMGGSDPRAKVIVRFRGILRRLERLSVLIPFAERIVFPSSRMEHRREHECFLSLIEASALLHQYQRGRQDNQIVASEDDFQHAVAAITGLLGVQDDGVSTRARPVLKLIQGNPNKSWTMAEIVAGIPNLSRGTIRRVLDELQKVELVVSPRCGRGRAAREYKGIDSNVLQPLPNIHLSIPRTDSKNWPPLGQYLANISPEQERRYA